MQKEITQKEESVSFSEDVIQKIWERGEVVPWCDPDVWRKDECGAWIGRRFYGNRDSQYGWQISWSMAGDKVENEEISGLCPLQWENFASRQAGRMQCVVSSVYEKNVRLIGRSGERVR